MATTAQTNGIHPSTSASTSGPSQPLSQGTTTTIPNTQPSNPPASQQQQQQQHAARASSPPTTTNPNSSSSTHHQTAVAAPRPRDARTIELLLTSQGVTSFDARVPLLLMDFAYRHTSSILHDALHLSGDPYTSHAGSKPSASSGAVPVAPPGGDASVSTNAINIAIASRQTYQFRNASSSSSAGGSKEWLQELARERNKVALPRILPNEWGIRLPNERFVLGGQAWSLRENLLPNNHVYPSVSDLEDDDEEDEEEDDDDEDMEDVRLDGAAADGEGENGGGGGGGGLDDFLPDDMADEDMDMDGDGDASME
ncbi:transcription initiation factor IID, 31kD subunit-domain-containing protein [Xylariaceae sp. FL0594]|nr:transcription initiation factor IID, 31kD subunit-domain-containing protein [Xylariaceae sp. FL0594]